METPSADNDNDPGILSCDGNLKDLTAHLYWITSNINCGDCSDLSQDLAVTRFRIDRLKPAKRTALKAV